MTGQVSIGIAGALGPAAVADIARATEDAGLHTLWVNDTPDGDALVALAAAARVTRRLRLATGVLPVDRRSAAEIIAAASSLPADRLTLGIGSGQARTGVVDLVRATVDALRAQTAARLMVGGLGPRMRRLAASDSDGVVLNWLTPTEGARQCAEAHAVDADTHVALYVRTALDEKALPRLHEEAARYGSYPNYAANFARMGVRPGDTVLIPPTADTGLAAYRAAVDEVVLRAITPDDDVRAYEAFVSRAGVLASA